MDRCPKCGWHHTDECMGENMAADHNPAIPRTRTPILISAMRLLAQEIQSMEKWFRKNRNRRITPAYRRRCRWIWRRIDKTDAWYDFIH